MNGTGMSANCNHHSICPFKQGNKIIVFLRYTKESRYEGKKTSNEHLASTKKT